MLEHPKDIERAPRRVRGMLAGHIVFDTTNALYVWDVPYFPQYYIPVGDVDPEVFEDEDHVQELKRGAARSHRLKVGDVERANSARLFTEGDVAGMVRFDWKALDAWFEEDEEIFVHPRDPYTRVDALRSTRQVRVELDGVVLAESDSPVLVFETGLPTRYYLNRTDVHFDKLTPSDTVTACPYKGTTSGYWSVSDHPDIAWAYDFTTREVLPIAGLVAFYNEKVDIFVDGVKQ
jgi:uncharacterized protein (DUF427 family)